MDVQLVKSSANVQWLEEGAWLSSPGCRESPVTGGALKKGGELNSCPPLNRQNISFIYLPPRV